MAVGITKRLFTVEDYHRMGEVGILSDEDRVELIEGEIVEMTPIGEQHAACVNRTSDVLGALLRPRAIISVQNPARIGPLSEPQPDVALLRRKPDYYSKSHPGPDDILLVIEVADTSLDKDRVKIALYAKAGIREAWLVDVNSATIEVHRQPTPQGYRAVRSLRRGQPLPVDAFPDVTLTVDDILG